MKTRGFTLTELTIVLSVAGVVIGGLWGIAASSTSMAKQENMAQLIATIAYNMRGYYSGRATVETTNVDVLMPLLVARNIIPSNVLKTVSGTTVALSSFGELTNQTKTTSVYKSIYVCGWSVSGTVSSKCTFNAAGATVTDVPLFAIETILAKGSPCVNAVIRNSNPGTLPGLTAVYVTAGVTTKVYTALPVAPADAISACSAAINHVDFVFRTAS